MSTTDDVNWDKKIKTGTEALNKISSVKAELTAEIKDLTRKLEHTERVGGLMMKAMSEENDGLNAEITRMTRELRICQEISAARGVRIDELEGRGDMEFVDD
jgi:Zn-dependent M32 family carboxypeptidase